MNIIASGSTPSSPAPAHTAIASSASSRMKRMKTESKLKNPNVLPAGIPPPGKHGLPPPLVDLSCEAGLVALPFGCIRSPGRVLSSSHPQTFCRHPL